MVVLLILTRNLDFCFNSTVTSPAESSVLESDADLDALTFVMPTQRKLKEPSLNLTFPAKGQGMELKVLVQPEDNHRARYMTEGSRGAVKDKKQDGFPMVKVRLKLLTSI